MSGETVMSESADKPKESTIRKIQKSFSVSTYIIPSFIFLVILFACLVQAGLMSVHLSELSIPGSENIFVGARNYIIVLTQPLFQNAFLISIGYSLLSPTSSIFFGFAIAMLITRYCRRGLPVFKTIFVIPPMIAPIVVSYMWRLVFMSTDVGYLNYFLKYFLGIQPIGFFADPWFARFILYIVWQWSGIPFQFLVFTAALLSIPKQLYESAEIDGASAINRFRHVTFPMVRPLLITLLLLGITGGLLGGFDAVYVLTSGGPSGATDVLGYRAYAQGFQYNHMGQATALTMIMTVIVVAYVLGGLREHMRTQW